jgi:hypothetical protein
MDLHFPDPPVITITALLKEHNKWTTTQPVSSPLLHQLHHLRVSVEELQQRVTNAGNQISTTKYQQQNYCNNHKIQNPAKWWIIAWRVLIRGLLWFVADGRWWNELVDGPTVQADERGRYCDMEISREDGGVTLLRLVSDLQSRLVCVKIRRRGDDLLVIPENLSFTADPLKVLFKMELTLIQRDGSMRILSDKAVGHISPYSDTEPILVLKSDGLCRIVAAVATISITQPRP